MRISGLTGWNLASLVWLGLVSNVLEAQDVALPPPVKKALSRYADLKNFSVKWTEKHGRFPANLKQPEPAALHLVWQDGKVYQRRTADYRTTEFSFDGKNVYVGRPEWVRPSGATLRAALVITVLEDRHVTYLGKTLGPRTCKGIYGLKGEKLTVCIAAPGRDRPSEFKCKEGDETLLVILKRAKPADGGPAKKPQANRKDDKAAAQPNGERQARQIGAALAWLGARGEAAKKAVAPKKEQDPPPQTVTLEDGTWMRLDGQGILTARQLNGRFVVGWNSQVTVAEAEGPFRVRLRDTPLTLDLRNFAGKQQAVVRVRAIGGDAPVELRLRSTGKYPARLEIRPVQEEHDVDLKAGDKAVWLALRAKTSTSQVEIEVVKGAVTTRLIHSPDR